MIYKKYERSGQIFIKRVYDEAWIPPDEANTDYQAYLEWLAEGNEPEVIDLSE
jgi:hypothetical protein